MSFPLVLCVILSAAVCLWLGYANIKLRKRITVYAQQITELQDIAWRAQMNPHFLHNCLNNINAFIHQLDPKTASSYLTCLSRLLRNILEHSDKATITLARELDMLQQYIKLENLRFGADVEINVSVDEHLQTDTLAVPPLFIQPFLENAILHGILPKQGKGNVNISISLSDPSTLSCTITDDGVGRKKANPSDPTTPLRRSMGMDITRKRIELFNRVNGKSLPLTIDDLRDDNGAGTGTSIAILLVLVSAEPDFD
ncbi:MAG: hypothetical protein EOO88_46815 [Pedobacter sp.]|nr:MAG: hypothetical protein EOO88_46815 [Pedobacter sp.]